MYQIYYTITLPTSLPFFTIELYVYNFMKLVFQETYLESKGFKSYSYYSIIVIIYIFFFFEKCWYKSDYIF